MATYGTTPFAPELRIYPNGDIYSTRLRRLLKHSISTPHGYPVVFSYVDGKQKRFYVHRLIALALIPNPDNKPYVNHIDGNKGNSILKNLEWCTMSENIKHNYRLGYKGNLGKKYNKRKEKCSIQ